MVSLLPSGFTYGMKRKEPIKQAAEENPLHKGKAMTPTSEEVRKNNLLKKVEEESAH